MHIQNRVKTTKLKKKFVHLPEEYKYCLAMDYLGGKGILKVEVIKD